MTIQRRKTYCGFVIFYLELALVFTAAQHLSDHSFLLLNHTANLLLVVAADDEFELVEALGDDEASLSGAGEWDVECEGDVEEGEENESKKSDVV